MKVAITSKGKTTQSLVDARFGRTKYLLIFDTETGDSETIDNCPNLNAVQGAGIQTAQNITGLNVDAVITGNIGPKAFKTLKAANIKTYLVSNSTVQQALEEFNTGQLQQTQQENVEGHWI